MTPLTQALPYLVRDIEDALVRLGRGSVADQLREVNLESWTYDEFADTTILQVRSPQESTLAEYGETVSLYDELGINLEIDVHGHLMSIEILDGRRVASQLGSNPDPQP